jgi:hypothetical protein
MESVDGFFLGMIHPLETWQLFIISTSGHLAKYDKLIVSLRTAYAREYSLDKEQASYDDSLDALRLALKGFEFR